MASDMFAQFVAWLVTFVQKYPIVSSVFFGMGILRALMKPIFSVWHTFVESTPSKKDDAVLARVEGSKVVKTLTYVLDWIASIKLVDSAKTIIQEKTVIVPAAPEMKSAPVSHKKK